MASTHSDLARSGAQVVVIVASAGGVPALMTLLSQLPGTFPAPIVIVQHRPTTRESLLLQVLVRATPLHVVEAKENDRLEPGTVYVARPDLHLTISRHRHVHYCDGQRIRHVLSSANPLFVSSAEAFGPGTIGVVLTGTGSDGTDGVQAIKRRGGVVIAQDQHTSKFFSMAASAIATGAVDYVLPLDEIAPMLRRLTHTEPVNTHAELI